MHPIKDGNLSKKEKHLTFFNLKLFIDEYSSEIMFSVPFPLSEYLDTVHSTVYSS